MTRGNHFGSALTKRILSCSVAHPKRGVYVDISVVILKAAALCFLNVGRGRVSIVAFIKGAVGIIRKRLMCAALRRGKFSLKLIKQNLICRLRRQDRISIPTLPRRLSKAP